MKKILFKSFLLAVALMLLKPPKANAQICPISLFNNNTTVALANMTLYNTWVPGTYTVSFIHDATYGCTEVFTTDMFVGKSNDLMGILGRTPSGGMGIYFDLGPYLNPDPMNCSGLPGNAIEPNGLHHGGVSINIQQGGPAGPVIFSIDYTENSVDQCFYPPLAVVWGSFNTTGLTGPKRIVLDWQTLTESDVDHFSIEKSYDGYSWHKVGHVGAVGNSTMPQNYSFTDYNVADYNYYRVVAVDWDCSRDVSLIRLARCTDGPTNPNGNSCPASFPAPGGLPVDCPAPPTLPYISGTATICGNVAKLYRLNNVYGNATVTWSMSPSYLATLSPVSKMVQVMPTGNAGNGTLTATVVKNGVTSYYNYIITFGQGATPLFGWCNTTGSSGCNNYTNFTATVNMLPGTVWSDYHWYQDGYYYLGSGTQHEWQNIWPGQVINFEVYYFGPCGTSMWSGSSQACDMEAKPVAVKPRERFSISPNPARSNISIERIPPCEDPGPWEPQYDSKAAPKKPLTATISETAIIKIFDAQGRLRKTTSMSGASKRLTVNASDLPAGLYFVNVIEPGKEPVTLKVLLEK